MSKELIIRGLSEDEISTWANFCASCFSYKPDPPLPSYFERHYYNDPRRDSTLIRVAVNADGEIVSSVRVFRRTVSLGASTDDEATVSTAEAGGKFLITPLPCHCRHYVVLC